jgi:hypothetical protein
MMLTEVTTDRLESLAYESGEPIEADYAEGYCYCRIGTVLYRARIRPPIEPTPIRHRDDHNPPQRGHMDTAHDELASEELGAYYRERGIRW